MRTHIPSYFVVATLLALGGCQLTLVAFHAPATVLVDEVFEVVVDGTSDAMAGTGGCVVQLPLGFTVVGAITTIASSMTAGTPALLATYVAEPGHFLSCWTAASAPDATGRLKVFVRAPAHATVGTIKVALAATASTTSSYVANAPAGVTDFAQITAPAHVRTVAVVTVPTTAYAPETEGLPYGIGTTTWTLPWAGVAVGDLDGDGDSDLVATGPQLRAWFRTGATWTERSNGLFGSGQRGRVAIGDFDGDGHADIVHGTGRVFFGDGAGNWTPGPQLPQFLTFAVATGDVDGDGRSDVAFGSWYQDHLQVFLGNGNRTFTDASVGLPNQNGIGSVDLLLRDVTGDGHVDLVWNQVWAGDGQGNWTAGGGFGPEIPWGIASGDLDGDGSTEVVVVSQATQGVSVYSQTGGNQWTPVANTGLPVAAWQTSVAVLDFDRDGRLDVALGGVFGAGLELWRNLGGATFALAPSPGLPSNLIGNVADLDFGDFNGDTWPDLAGAIGSEGLGAFSNWLPGLSQFGDGCANGLAQAPTVVGTGAPALGNNAFAVQVAGGSPGSLGLCWFGFSRYVWAGVTPLPLGLAGLGAPGCTLWTGGESTTWGIFDAAGRFQRSLPIPNHPAFLRFTLFAQGAAHALGSPLPMAVTPGLAIRIE